MTSAKCQNVCQNGETFFSLPSCILSENALNIIFTLLFFLFIPLPYILSFVVFSFASTSSSTFLFFVLFTYSKFLVSTFFLLSFSHFFRCSSLSPLWAFFLFLSTFLLSAIFLCVSSRSNPRLSAKSLCVCVCSKWNRQTMWRIEKKRGREKKKKKMK